MSYPINYPTPQGANIQIFSQGGSTSDWVKPQGASFVWFTLIGGGGGGGGSTGSGIGAGGGGSAAVTNFMGPAFLMPDQLRVSVGANGVGGATGVAGTTGGTSSIVYQLKDTTGYTLLTANGGGGGANSATGTAGAAATAMTANYFTAMGFFQSIAGQAGGAPGSASITASATTFLSGGAALQGSVTGNYGYFIPSNANGCDGFFMMQPIIVGLGGSATNTVPTVAAKSGGAGCGGAGGSAAGTGNQIGGNGGSGLVVIITW